MTQSDFAGAAAADHLIICFHCASTRSSCCCCCCCAFSCSLSSSPESSLPFSHSVCVFIVFSLPLLSPSTSSTSTDDQWSLKSLDAVCKQVQTKQCFLCGDPVSTAHRFDRLQIADSNGFFIVVVHSFIAFSFLISDFSSPSPALSGVTQ